MKDRWTPWRKRWERLNGGREALSASPAVSAAGPKQKPPTPLRAASSESQAWEGLCPPLSPHGQKHAERPQRDPGEGRRGRSASLAPRCTSPRRRPWNVPEGSSGTN